VIRDTISPILRPHRPLIVAAGAAMIGATAVTLSAPLLVKIAIDRGIRRHDVHVIDVMALVYVALVLTRPMLERVIVLCSARAGERFLGDLRVAAYEKLQALSMPFFEETRAGVLVSRLTNDVQTLTTFTRLVLVEVVGSLLLFVVSIVILVTLSPLLSLVMLVSVPLLAWSSLRYGKRSRPAFLALRDRVADTMSSLQEGLTGVRVVQSFGRESDRYASYRVRSNAQVTAWRRISLVNMGFFPMIAFAQSFALAAVLVVGGYLHRHGRVSIGTIVAFALYLISLFDPIARLGDWFSEFQSGRAALSKIATLLETPTTVVGGSTPLPAAGELRADDCGRRIDSAAVRRRAPRRRRHVRVRRQPPGRDRRDARDRARRAPRARRRDRCREVDAREAARPCVRPSRGRRHLRRRRPA
jgi:ATP-binding cassette subfamily B protein